MGWDDNGLPTERRVQNYFGVRCDPSLPHDPDFTPPENPDPKRQVLDRPAQLHRALRAARARRTRRSSRSSGTPLGLSVDWSQTYTTVGRDSAARQPAGVPAQLRPRRGLPRRTPRRCGTSPSRPRSPRPSSRPASTPATTTASPSTGSRQARPAQRARPTPRARPAPRARLHRDHAARADPRLCGRADRPPRRRALPGAVRDDRDQRRSSASRSPSLAHHGRPSPTRAPASRCAARSATSPTCSGGASSSSPCAR